MSAFDNTWRILSDIFADLAGTGFVHSPRIVQRADFDLSKFFKQECDIEGIATEYVYQTGPGIAGDDFAATVVYPFGDKLLVVECNT